MKQIVLLAFFILAACQPALQVGKSYDTKDTCVSYHEDFHPNGIISVFCDSVRTDTIYHDSAHTVKIGVPRRYEYASKRRPH